MRFFNWLTSKKGTPVHDSERNMEFTPEEAEEINSTIAIWSEVFNKDAPPGTRACIPRKAKDAIIAKALNQYVEHLNIELIGAGDEAKAAIMEKAIQAQMKAYLYHGLPAYIYQLAGMLEFSGDIESAKKCFQLFLDAQREFQADKIDAILLRETGLDVAEAVAKAEAKLAPPKTMTTLADLRKALRERMEEQEKQERTLSDLREALKHDKDNPTEMDESVFD
jgi:hypothetical protein